MGRHRVRGKDASKGMVHTQAGVSHLFRGFDDKGRCLALSCGVWVDVASMWGSVGCYFPFPKRTRWEKRLLCQFIFTPESLASHQLLPSSVSLNLCKGPLGRDVQVGGFGILATCVTSLLVIFNPVTVFLSLEKEKEMGWAGAAQLSGVTEDDDEWEEAMERRREKNSHHKPVLAVSRVTGTNVSLWSGC